MPTWTLFFLFPDGHLILSGRENVRLFSLFQRVVNPESRGWESTPSSVFPPACSLILSGQSRPDLDAAERPTTSEVRTDLTGVLKTCFVFFFFFLCPFFRRDLRGRPRLALDQSDSPRVVASEAKKPRPLWLRRVRHQERNSASGRCSGSDKNKIKKTNLSRQCGALRGSELPQT